MSLPAAAESLTLNEVEWMQGIGSPNAGSGTHAEVGSYWLRGGGGITQTYLKVTSNDRGWVLQNLANLTIYNVKNAPFNAKGDGTTDDTAAINLAITTALASGGGCIYFPAVNVAAGECYRFTKPATGLGSVQLNGAANLLFMGDGYASRLAMIGSAAGGDWYMFRLKDGTHNIKFFNLGFLGTGITNPDPNDQNHYIRNEGLTAETVGTDDVEIRECYFGTIVGDMVQSVGNLPAEVTDIRMIYNVQDADHCRSFCEAQRGTRRIQVHFNWIFGSDDNDIDFEPTGSGPAAAGPEEWAVIGNHINHQSRSTDCITISGIDTTNTAKRNLFAYNNITHGGQIAGLSVVGDQIVGNIVAVDSTMADPCILVFRTCEDVQITENVSMSLTAVAGRQAIRLASNTGIGPLRSLISDNVCLSNEATCIETEGSEISVLGNMCVATSASVGSIGGIASFSLIGDTDHVTTQGNMILAGDKNMSIGIDYHAQSGFSVRNTGALYNLIRGCTAGILWDRATTETFLDWRIANGNLVLGVTSNVVNTSPTTTPVTLEGQAGPGGQILLMPSSVGPEGNAAAPIGSVCTSTLGAPGAILWIKEEGTGLSGGSTGWSQDGADEIAFGVTDIGSALTTQFLPPGAGQPAPLDVEIQVPITRPGSIRNLRAACIAGTGGGNTTITVRKNGADTALTATFANTGTGAANTINTFTVVAGDVISISIVKSLAPTTTQKNFAVMVDISA